MLMTQSSPPHRRLTIPWLRIIGSIIAFIALVLLFLADLDPNVKLLVFIIGMTSGAWAFTLEAVEAVFEKNKINTDVLMTLAYLGATFLGQWTEALMLVFLYSITETLETITVQRTRNSIHALVKLIPPTGLVLREGGEFIDVPVEQLVPGDHIRVKPGDRTPTDILITNGQAFFDESSLTGEATPVTRVVGDTVLAGVVCVDGLVEADVLRPVAESAVSRIIHLVEEAQQNKHPTHLLVNKFTKYYNPLIVVLALAVGLVGGFLSNDYQASTIMGVTVLVAAAPCALAIGTPVTVISAIGTAGRRGILVKGGAALEQLGTIEGMAFDKTGTLTSGHPLLTSLATSGCSEDEALALAAALEVSSRHPLAKTLIEEAKVRNIQLPVVDDYKTIPGEGVEGTSGGERYSLGVVKPSNVSPLLSETYLNEKSKGRTMAGLKRGDELIALFSFEDHPRPDARQALDELRKLKIKTWLVTGDNKTNAALIGQGLGFGPDQVYAEMSPSDKGEVIKELQSTGMRVGMIGDGINDAPALALANIGVAMGTASTDVTVETADISIMADDLQHLVSGVRLGRKMRRVILQNIVLSSAIIAGVVFGVLLGWVDLTFAILAHEGSEVLIVGNSLRLLSRVST